MHAKVLQNLVVPCLHHLQSLNPLPTADHCETQHWGKPVQQMQAAPVLHSDVLLRQGYCAVHQLLVSLIWDISANALPAQAVYGLDMTQIYWNSCTKQRC